MLTVIICFAFQIYCAELDFPRCKQLAALYHRHSQPQPRAFNVKEPGNYSFFDLTSRQDQELYSVSTSATTINPTTTKNIDSANHCSVDSVIESIDQSEKRLDLVPKGQHWPKGQSHQLVVPGHLAVKIDHTVVPNISRLPACAGQYHRTCIDH